MLLGDYGHGKPLTARRIIAVKKAIDTNGAMREKGVSQFRSPETRNAALAMGYREPELVKLARAVNFYAQTQNCTETQALQAVAEPGSKANRLLDYGVRFFDSANSKLIIVRMLRNIDRLAALDAKGNLTAKNIVTTCFPDMNRIRNYELGQLHGFLQGIYGDLGDLPPMESRTLMMAMDITGCTLEEARAAMQNGTSIPVPRYVSEAQMKLKDFCTLAGAQAQMELDLARPESYFGNNDPNHPLIADRNFGVTFAGEGRFVANGTEEGRANGRRVSEKSRSGAATSTSARPRT